MTPADAIPTKARAMLEQLDRNYRIRTEGIHTWGAGLAPASRVLDVGAGTCQYRSAFSHCRYTALDHPASTMAPPGVEVVRADLTEIPLPAASIDAILCSEVFEHVEQPLRAIEEFARVLVPGGELYLTVPAACRIHRVPTMFYSGFGPDFFERSMPARGFEIVDVRPLGGWTDFMAQELSRVPEIIRSNAGLPRALRAGLHAVTWPTFRIAVPLLFHAWGFIEPGADMPLGWLVRARRQKR